MFIHYLSELCKSEDAGNNVSQQTGGAEPEL